MKAVSVRLITNEPSNVGAVPGARFAMGDPEQPRLLDFRGLRCPLPALKTKRALRFARPGRRLLVLSDDPLALVDIPNAVREAGDAVVSTGREGDAATFLVMKR